MKSNLRNLTISKAMVEAIDHEMAASTDVFVMGEDVGKMGSVFGSATGLYQKYGGERVKDTPISESGFIGAAVGAAALGMRPIVELMFVDFVGVCLDPIYNLAAKNAYFSGGKQPIPMVLMTAIGGGFSDGGQHSQCLYATFAHLPGLKVVIPSNAYDAKGLMISAIRDNNPVIFMFNKALQGIGVFGNVPGAVSPVPEEDYTVPIGKAVVTREGTDVTLVGLGATVHQSLEAAEILEEEGVSAEVVDLRSLVPLDRETIIQSVRKTGRLVVVDDDYRGYGVSGEVIASVMEQDISCMKAPPKRVAHPDVPIPFSRPLEQYLLPNVDKILATVRSIL